MVDLTARRALLAQQLYATPPECEHTSHGPHLDVFPLSVVCRAIAPVTLPVFAGSAVRGALFGAVRDLACVNQAAPSCRACSLHQVCGVSRLLATVEEDGPRGVEVPRPFVIRPPLEGARTVAPGETFKFGITLIGDEALRLFPYVALGLRRMGDLGLGRALPRRGCFAVERVTAVNPFLGTRQTVLRAGDDLVTLPEAPVTAAQIAAWCAARGTVHRLTVRLRTPLRLVVNKELVKRLTFEALLRRILRRTTDLARSFGEGVPPVDYADLLVRAAAVQTVEDRTQWLELESKSARQGRTVPIGGLVGAVTFEGPIGPFLPWLLWGQLLGVGKDVTKGNGVIEVRLDWAVELPM
jgi:hypothetical protein